MLTEVALGSYARDYLREYLSHGGTLASLILSLPLDAGRIYTFVPENTSSYALQFLTSGGVIKETGVKNRVAALTASYLSGGADRVAVFEDILGRSSDSDLSKSGIPYFTFRDEVYFYLSGVGLAPQTVERAIRWTYSFRFFATLSRISIPLTALQNSVTETDIQAIADGSDCVLVGVYDGEGILVWQRSEYPIVR